LRLKAFRIRAARSLSVPAWARSLVSLRIWGGSEEVCVIDCALQGMAVFRSHVKIVSYEKAVSGLESQVHPSLAEVTK
jgi:hypothetical protein